MEKKFFYFDTSIWLDFFENRDEPNLPKGAWARKLIRKIIQKEDRIFYSDLNMLEFQKAGYSSYDIEDLIRPLSSLLIFIESKEKQVGRAKDLASKRKIPKHDALHAFLARDHNAILVTLDHHFQKIGDIIKPYRTNELL